MKIWESTHIPVAVIHFTALHASRLSTPFLALRLVVLAKSSTSFSSRPAMSFLVLAGPLLSLFTLLLLLTKYQPEQDLPILVINSIALVPTIVCLLFLHSRSNDSIPGIQLFRHNLLLLCLAAAMFTSVLLSIARMLRTPANYSGALVALTCADGIMSFGQGVFFLAVFGLDKVGILLRSLLFLGEQVTAFRASRTQAAAAASFTMDFIPRHVKCKKVYTI